MFSISHTGDNVLVLQLANLKFPSVVFSISFKEEASRILELVWEKPVIVFYKERLKKPERKAFAVVKARRLVISRVEEENANFRGNLKDFFPFMGDIDYISSKEGVSDRYVLCWLDDKEDDFSKAWRRLTGVTFPAGITFITDESGKRTYNANFIAEHGKLK